ncbi:MAG: hypothetical protein IJ466_10760 [Clostridia bacterium]|nr:hypothetical protein [Clostridia bacterium]
MGKKIDGFVLSAAAAAALYFYFQKAFGNRVLSAILALLGLIVLRRALRMLGRLLGNFGWMKKRRLRRYANGAVLKMAAMPEQEAQEAIEKLLRKCYEGEYTLALVQSHPSVRLSEGQVFRIWKDRQGSDKLVICATCRADAACRTMAATLKGPKVAIVDAEALCQMIAEHPEDYPLEQHAAAHAKLRLKHISSLLFNRRNAPRNLLFAGSMVLMYVFSGNIWYLAAAMALLFLSLASLHRNTRPAKLF